MGWSTRELAQLAGISLRTVRHYHDLGLLDEPDRLSNGYKLYRSEHLVRLFQIRRLTGFGFTLATIALMGKSANHLDAAILQEADAELAAAIAKLEEARREIANLTHRSVPVDLPFELSAAATDAELSTADRALLVVFSQLMGETGARHWLYVLQGHERTEAATEFDNLPPEADEQTREALAQRLAPPTKARLKKYPLPQEVVDQLARDRLVIDALGAAVQDLYNPAQLDVFGRVARINGELGGDSR